MNSLQNITGQWFGRQVYEGKPTLIIVNFEARSPGSAQVIGVDPEHYFRTICVGSIEEANGKIQGRTFNYQVFDAGSGIFIPLAEQFRRVGSTETPPESALYAGEFDGVKIRGSFKNNLDKSGQFELWKGFAEPPADNNPRSPEVMGPLTWEEFKKHVAKFHKRRGQVLFRGQANQFPLRTSFHREGRNNLLRYVDEDLSQLRHRINSISTHYYQTHLEDFLGLISLAQHHGFPTPLLDWSQSPYVAAFFAFDLLSNAKGWARRSKDLQAVRIFIFEWDKWKAIDRVYATSLKDPWPDVQLVHPPAHNNPRYYAQQAVAAFSNVDDIESFVTAIEVRHKTKFLTRIDILASERENVQEDLRFMGITPATLFPGIEGACKSLRDELF